MKDVMNPLREILSESKRPLVGAILSFPSPRLVEFLGLSGFDWLFLDGEHDGISPEACYTLSAVARSVGMTTVARVPAGRHDYFIQYADSGVDGIAAPHVRNGIEARELTEAMWFPPHGTRGMATSSRAARYGMLGSATDYVDNAELRPVPIAMLEDVEAFTNLDQILDTPGLEVGFLGAGDLSASVGVPARVNDPRVRELVDQGIAGLHQRGKKAILAFSDANSAVDAIDRGADMIAIYVGKLFAAASRDLLDSIDSHREKGGIGS